MLNPIDSVLNLVSSSSSVSSSSFNMISAATYISLIQLLVCCMSVCGVVASIIFDFISQNIYLDLRFCRFAVYLFFRESAGPPKMPKSAGPAAYAASAIWLIRPCAEGEVTVRICSLSRRQCMYRLEITEPEEQTVSV